MIRSTGAATRNFSPTEHDVFWRLMQLMDRRHPTDLVIETPLPQTVQVLGQPFTADHFTLRHAHQQPGRPVPTFYYCIYPGELGEQPAWLVQIHKYAYQNSPAGSQLPGFLHGDEAAYLRDMTMLRTALC